MSVKRLENHSSIPEASPTLSHFLCAHLTEERRDCSLQVTLLLLLLLLTPTNFTSSFTIAVNPLFGFPLDIQTSSLSILLPSTQCFLLRDHLSLAFLASKHLTCAVPLKNSFLILSISATPEEKFNNLFFCKSQISFFCPASFLQLVFSTKIVASEEDFKRKTNWWIKCRYFCKCIQETHFLVAKLGLFHCGEKDV